MGTCRRMMLSCMVVIIAHSSRLLVEPDSAQSLTLVEFNCENLFDCLDDSLKQDEEFLPEATRHWTSKR